MWQCIAASLNFGVDGLFTLCRGSLQYEWSGDPKDQVLLKNLKKDDFVKRYEIVANDHILDTGDRAAGEFHIDVQNLGQFGSA